MQVLPLIMRQSAQMDCHSTMFLVPFCCATAAAGRQTVLALASSPNKAEAQAYVEASFDKAVQGW